MAQFHNNAGKYTKDEANRRFNRVMGIGLILMAVLGFLSGAFLTHAMGYLAFVVFIIAMSSVWIAFKKWIEPIMDAWARERIKFMRGGQAEGLVGWVLKGLDDDWYVFNNLQLEDASDIDHVVVGPGGLWCISTKGARGLITLSADGQLLYNLKSVNWLAATKAQVMALRDRLAAMLGRDDVPFINGMLAVPLAFIDLRSPHQLVYVVHQDDLLRPIEAAPRKLNKAEVLRIVNVLEMKALYRRPEQETASSAIS